MGESRSNVVSGARSKHPAERQSEDQEVTDQGFSIASSPADGRTRHGETPWKDEMTEMARRHAQASECAEREVALKEAQVIRLEQQLETLGEAAHVNDEAMAQLREHLQILGDDA